MCRKSFSRYRNLKLHMFIILVKNICMSTELTIIRAHKNTYYSKTICVSYVSKIIFDTFLRNVNLKLHILHILVKNHICHVCQLSFHLKSHLKTHKRVHSGEIPSVCHVCQKSFSRKENLKPLCSHILVKNCVHAMCASNHFH